MQKIKTAQSLENAFLHKKSSLLHKDIFINSSMYLNSL